MIPGLGRSPGGGHSSILAWKIPRDRGAWWDTAHRVTKSWTWLSDQAHSTRGIPLYGSTNVPLWQPYFFKDLRTTAGNGDVCHSMQSPLPTSSSILSWILDLFPWIYSLFSPSSPESDLFSPWPLLRPGLSETPSSHPLEAMSAPSHLLIPLCPAVHPTQQPEHPAENRQTTLLL